MKENKILEIYIHSILKCMNQSLYLFCKFIFVKCRAFSVLCTFPQELLYSKFDAFVECTNIFVHTHELYYENLI